jgi:hypothetical protein
VFLFGNIVAVLKRVLILTNIIKFELRVMVDCQYVGGFLMFPSPSSQGVWNSTHNVKPPYCQPQFHI